MRTTLRVPDDVLIAAKRRAAADGVTLTRFVEDALRAQLAARPAKSAERVTLPTFRGQGVRPGVDLEDTARLLDVMEGGVPPVRRR
jgi:hypothetical protein